MVHCDEHDPCSTTEIYREVKIKNLMRYLKLSSRDVTRSKMPYHRSYTGQVPAARSTVVNSASSDVVAAGSSVRTASDTSGIDGGEFSGERRAGDENGYRRD